MRQNHALSCCPFIHFYSFQHKSHREHFLLFILPTSRHSETNEPGRVITHCKGMSTARQHFALTLMVNHACNLRCTYCYTGAKFSSPLPLPTGQAAIQRAFRSLIPNGTLNLGFFGGEPLLEAPRILEWMTYARQLARESDKHVNFTLTTNGTVNHSQAWQVMMAKELELAVSFDGSPSIHDRHRREVHGKATSATVQATIRRLLDAGKEFRVVTVVRPDNLADLPKGLEFLHALGVRAVDLSLDLWTSWSSDDAHALKTLITDLSKLWAQWLPDFSLSWFDAKVAELARLQKTTETVRCGFGDGEIAVAPSGRLYPCERLIGEDRPGNPLCLPGNALEGTDFLDSQARNFTRCSPCSKCDLAYACDTFCRCSNFIRTGDTNRPDGLLCLFNKAVASTVADVLNNRGPIPNSPFPIVIPTKENCYA
jgi:uncharacterized protein